ncbi:Homoserine dehydrogenase [Ectocarpus siliculosus]|uniref:Homoserine dehydrogenase n=1 Tax=Ectocarpus siliculosus TaxID=2880 RepID=D8LHG9_ECTSI|nr:Homoserine dehydrogenase [Ectocarpus siliculosus]|eukprot:CBN79120.1 Homoserine dehydrogenase [Ectocarpus siliculosus]
MSLPLKVGMFGGGTVGGGVYEIMEQTKKELFKAGGVDVTIAKICVRDVNKKRSFELEKHTTMVTDYDEILEDDSINCVVELMGGVTHAKDVVFKALKKGKHVVTANKALLAQLLPEVKSLVAENAGTTLGYEAAVCGGIPIIHNMQGSYVGDSIQSVMGIMNGTTNFMLTKMETEGADYAAVLKEAQDLGFAEADPTADVEGHDVQAKIALLAKLAFGQDVALDKVPCAGISNLSSTDFACAKMMGCTIKLVGTAALGESKDKLAVFVSPVLVPLGGPLASTRGPGNVVVVRSENLTESVYAGPGAGRYPTANSVVNDIVRLARLGAAGTPPPFPLERPLELEPDFEACFYVRVTAADGLGVLSAVGAIASEAGVSVHSVLRGGEGGGGGGEEAGVVSLVVKTDSCLRSQVGAFVDGLKGKKVATADPVVMSIL